MVRVQVRFTEEQHRWLRETAAEQGISVSEVVRRAIDKLLDDRSKPSIEEIRKRAVAAAGSFRSSETDVSEHHDD